MAEEDEDDSCACCGSWNTYMAVVNREDFAALAAALPGAPPPHAA